jgi:antitoxin component YwqK of YwqJK toxin-antitoxin module
MNKSLLSALTLAALLASCGSDFRMSNAIVSERFVHKFGYPVSKQEWMERNYPGQVVTVMSSGVTITASYENRLLHGLCTHTYPNSQTVQYAYVYNEGDLVKETVYDPFGVPVKEEVKLSPRRHTLTRWYSDGTPMSIEDYADDELLEGEYFSMNNEVESRVEKGHGSRILRDPKGQLLSKESVRNGYTETKESFYANGTPESVVHYLRNQLHGEKRTFSPAGEPLAVEEWLNGKLHGSATYFQNGVRRSELHYLYGAKSGAETYYLEDGETIAQQIFWENDKRHGKATYALAGEVQTEWWYDGKKTSQKRYEELDRLDRIISQANNQ